MPKITGGARSWVGDADPHPVEFTTEGAYACQVFLGWSIRSTDGGPVIVDFRDGVVGGSVLASVIVPVSATSNITLPIPVRVESGAVYAKIAPAGRIARGVIYSA